MTVNKRTVLFLCMHNSMRSQMAEALLSKMLGDRFEAFSAGLDPLPVNPLAARVMAEVGIELDRVRSKGLEEFRGRQFDFVVTLCDDTSLVCPFYGAGRHLLHKHFPDPALVEGTEEEMLVAARRLRDSLTAWLTDTFGEDKGGRGDRARATAGGQAGK